MNTILIFIYVFHSYDKYTGFMLAVISVFTSSVMLQSFVLFWLLFCSPDFQTDLILLNYSVLRQSRLSQQNGAAEACWVHTAQVNGLKQSSAHECYFDFKTKNRVVG